MISYGVKLCKGGTGLDFTWYESLLYGMVSGLTDILPVSAQAHRQLLLKLFGASSDLSLMILFIHILMNVQKEDCLHSFYVICYTILFHNFYQ